MCTYLIARLEDSDLIAIRNGEPSRVIFKIPVKSNENINPNVRLFQLGLIGVHIIMYPYVFENER